ncbi:MAG: BTAD domain-containing putative transcriptional regulator [Geminicoccaceae bacterium]|nr:BTAD domain-containing putative transcriptional regulator [Geminicoccaceae bacterium]
MSEPAHPASAAGSYRDPAPFVPRDAGRWRLRLLGRMRLQAPEGSDRTPRGRRTRGLLAVLALADRAAATRERLAGLLWPDRSEEQARASLRQALRELRRCLDDPAVLVVERERVALALERVAVDVAELEAAAASAVPSGDRLELCEGELLEDLHGLGPAFDAWLAAHRARCRALALELLERALEGAEEPSEVRALCKRLLAIEPAHEAAHRALMLLAARGGDTAAAIRQFELCRAELARRFDARPSEATTSLLARIRAGTLASAALAPLGDPGRVRGARRNASGTPLAVLPFVEPDDGSGPGQGLAEEVARALARFRWLSVIAPSATATLVRQLLDPLAIAQRVEAEYVITGRLGAEASGNAIRVDLIEAATGRLLWTERERLHTDGSSDFACALAARLTRELLLREGQRAQVEPVERADPHRLVLRAVRHVQELEAAALDRALGLLRRAIALDPNCALAHAWLAVALAQRAGYGWRAGHFERFGEAERCAARAVQLDPAEALGLVVSSHCRALRRDFVQAQALSDAAIAANPALPLAWARRALLFCYRGDPERASECMERYRRLSPFDPFAPLFGRVLAFAHLLAGRFEEAVAEIERAAHAGAVSSSSYLPLVVALGHLGRSREAAFYLDRLLEFEPGFSLDAFLRFFPFEQSRHLELFAEGLMRAGLGRGREGAGTSGTCASAGC